MKPKPIIVDRLDPERWVRVRVQLAAGQKPNATDVVLNDETRAGRS